MVIDLRELLEAPGEQRSYDLDAAFPDLSGIELVSPSKGHSRSATPVITS